MKIINAVKDFRAAPFPCDEKMFCKHIQTHVTKVVMDRG